MAWNSIPTAVRSGSLVRADDIGTWLNTAITNADGITSNHCGANWTGYWSGHKTSWNGGNHGQWTNTRSNSRTGNKCGGEI